MAQKNNRIGTAAICLIAYGIAMLLDLISALIVSIFIYNEYLSFQQCQLIVFITHMLAVFLAIRYLINRVGERKILYVSCVAGGYFLTQIIASMLVFDGMISGTLLSILPITAGAISAFLLGRKPKKQGKRRRKR